MQRKISNNASNNVFFFYFVFTQSSAQGTVPYLGIFLTDLTMLDTAVKDRLDVSQSVFIPCTSKLWLTNRNNVIFALIAKKTAT